MGRFASVLLVGTVGCAQLAGIDNTTGLVPPEQVSLSFERISVGASVVRSKQDLTAASATYLVANDTAADGFDRIPATLAAFDTWVADIADGTPPILFNLPDYPKSIPRLWSFPLRNVKGLYGVMEHPHPTPAPDAAMLTVDLTLDTPYAANESYTLYNAGTWTVRGFSAGELPAVDATQLGPVTFAYTSMSSITGRPHEKITTADQPVVLRAVGADLTGYVLVPPFDQSGSDMITGTVVPNPHDKVLMAKMNPADLPARYSVGRPAVGNLANGWGVNAAPGYEIANNNGPTLQGGGFAAGDPGMINVTYGNPFTALGWRSVLVWSTNGNRTFTPAGQTLAATLYGALVQYLEPTDALMTLDLPASLPESITLAGKPLSTDGIMLAKPATAVTATFLTAAPCTLYGMQMFDLLPNTMNTALEYHFVLAQSSTQPQFSLTPDLFEIGHNYTVRAICTLGGYPNLATGDLTKRELPLAQGYYDSGVFTVMP